MSSRCRVLLFCGLLWMGLGVVGCGSGGSAAALVTVKGRVTLDGQPGADLLINFSPDAVSKDQNEVGMGSTATTDAQGKYELSYKGAGGKKGAVIGKHKVTIERGFAGGGPAGGATGAAEQEPLPPQYNMETTLTADVKDQDVNEINFDLTTK